MAKILKSLKLEADLIAYAESINPVFGQAIETIIIDHKNGNIEANFDEIATDLVNVNFASSTEKEPAANNNTVFIQLNEVENIEVKNLLMLNGFEEVRYLTTQRENEIQAQLQSIIDQKTKENFAEKNNTENIEYNTKTENLEFIILNLRNELNNEKSEKENLIVLHQKEIEQIKEQQTNNITPNLTNALNQLQEFRKCNIAVIQDFAHYSQNLTRKLRTKGTFKSIVDDHYPPHLHYLLQE
jgi:hypothetical protein